ncbi:LPS export ABC transporter periplasmic protein LptC [bacterium]|nr:LPS export ABC transporter periplasmic protein LptC [bacterium]
MKRTKHSKLRWIAIIISSGCLLASCASKPATQNQNQNQSSTPFIFKSLDLKQRRPDGVRDWELTSPEARYNTAARTVRAKIPKGILYFEDKPSFMISAEHATVLNDGELVVLEGTIRLKRFGAEPLLIQGDRLIWRPALSTMVINQRPVALNRNSRIISNSLIFQQQSGQLLFSGPTKLSRWEKNYSSTLNPQTVITAGNSRWNFNTGIIAAVGPILAYQDNGRELTAASIQGNTKNNFLDLKAPVQFKLEQDDAIVNAGETRWNFERDELSSKASVSASLPKGDVSGIGFIIDIRNNLLTISNSCEVAQLDKNLRAKSCTWDWGKDLLTAAGNVNFKESKTGQVQRAEQIDGALNQDGSIRFSPARDRVKTQIKLNTGKNNGANQDDSSQVTF